MIRTGNYRYVPWTQLETALLCGWLPVADLGAVHGYWSVLCWRCDCWGSK